MKADKLERAISAVVKNDNCSGCGACALIAAGVTMELDGGYMRPVVDRRQRAGAGRDEARLFHAVCPGVSLVAPRNEGRLEHPTFGPYIAAYQGYASDAEVRRAGSSAGVLTALTIFLTTRGDVPAIIGSGPGRNPARTVPVTIVDRETALRSAGSRYAPVSNLASYRSSDRAALVGKPCEVSAARQLHDSSGDSERPISLSFFCAGVPSQNATEQLIESLHVDARSVERLRYRGDGWPGTFSVADGHGNVGSLSYEESWGNHLGKSVQGRCKICPDGTGGDADVAVGDYWTADRDGFPLFTEGDGNSAILARTERGHALLKAAEAAGVIHLAPVSLDDVAAVQPLQVKRKQQLLGRLAGKCAVGRRVPRYRGYHLMRLALPHWRANLRDAIGSARRAAPSWLKAIAVRLKRRGAQGRGMP